jgi:hypothetical protein
MKAGIVICQFLFIKIKKMSKRRYVDTSFWDDNYITNLDPIEKLLFLYFLTNPLTNIGWVYELPIRRICFDTWIDKDMTNKIIDRFSKSWKIYYIDWWIYIRNFQKHQNLDNSKIKEWINRIKQEIPRSILEKIWVIDESYMSHRWVSNNLDSDLDSDLDLDGKSVIPEEPKNRQEDIHKTFKNKSSLSEKEYSALVADYWKRIIDDYIEDLENYIVNNPKWKHVKDCNLTLRNWLRKNWVKKRENKEIQPIQETDDFFNDLQKQIWIN